MIPIGCNCGSKKAKVKYQVKTPTGQKQTYATIAEAQAACKGCPIMAVPA